MNFDKSLLLLKNLTSSFKVLHIDGFDFAFYRKNYSDLNKLRGNRALVAHYMRHGQNEGRFINLNEARRHFAQLGRVLPADFDPHRYANLNPDLARLYDQPWQYELHFLRHGQEEGRPFSAADVRGGWQASFNYYDFLLFSESWREPAPLDRSAALALFERDGIARLTPIARDLIFDPSFYQQNYALDIATPADLYRDWLDNGFAHNRAPNEHQAIRAYIGDDAYPSGFDWRRFTKTRATDAAIYPAKIKALADLFDDPFGEDARRCVARESEQSVYLLIGDYQAARGNMEVALRCFDIASREASIPKPLVRRGDVLRMLGRDAEALASYQKALTFPSAPVWAIVRSSELQMKSGESNAAFDALHIERTRWAGNRAFHEAYQECVELRFTQIAGATRKLLEVGEVAAANAYAGQELSVLCDRIAEQTIDLPALGATSARIVMLACLDLPQCTHYRVEQKVEQLKSHGIVLEVFDFKDPTLFISALPGAAAAIFYRVPSYPKIVEAICYARGVGLTTFYDIDDLIFSEDYPDSFASYEDQISYETFIGLRHGVSLYRQAISLCDVGLASTQALADVLQGLVRSRTAHVIPNALDANVDDAERLATRPQARGNDVNIFYGSGTKAHNRDFNEIVGPALIALLARYPHITLTIVGFLNLHPAFGAYKDRIVNIPFVDKRSRYQALLASCDINLSVLSAGILNDCKSEIKWLEAAILKIPTVVSHTATFAAILDAPNDGLICRRTEDWVQTLSTLVENPDLRREIGAAAHRKALRLYSSANVGAKLVAAILPQGQENASIAAVSATELPKLLVCNVFFAPQSYGGATRVVEANVDYFIDHYASMFDVSVVTTDYGVTAGTFRVETYRGIKVFRIGTPTEVNMDWRPFNDDNILHYGRALDLVQPSLVHFHCIQRLTASIVQETQRRGIPYVVTVHDAWWISDYQFLVDQNDMPVAPDDRFKSTLPNDVDRVQSIERRQTLGSLLNAAHATLAVSDSFADIYRRAGISNVRCIANGTGPLPPRLPSTSNPRKLVLGHVGGRSVHKGAALIEVTLRESNFENLELLMVDSTIDPGYSTSRVWGKTVVTIIGQYPQARVNELFASFDVLLAPSIWPESFGLVTREGAFYGKWIIASDRGAIADEIKDGVDGFKIDVSSTAGLRTVLEQMNRAPMSYKDLPSNTASRSADSQANDLAALYMNIFKTKASDQTATVR